MEKLCAELLAKIVNRAARPETGSAEAVQFCKVPAALLAEAAALLAQCPNVEHLPDVKQAVKRTF